MVMMTILGWKWLFLHHYSLYVIIIVRAIYLMIQVQMLIEEVEPFPKYFDYHSWSTSLMLRIFLPSSLLFLTRWKPFLIFLVPFVVIAQIIFVTNIEKVYSVLANCDQMKENFSVKNTINKDLTLMIALIIGIYSHSKTLVSRHITH